jgi:hypothetical protein
MKTLLFGVALLAGLSAQSPAPSDSPTPYPQRTAIVTCSSTPLYLWDTTLGRPYRSRDGGSMHNGQRVTVISMAYSTLAGFNFYETDIPTVEVEPYGTSPHYWIRADCIPPAPRK